MWLDLPDQSSGCPGVVPDSFNTNAYAFRQDPRNAFRQNPSEVSASVHNGDGDTRGQAHGETIAGFVIYRLENRVVEYLLLKKVNQNDWSPPKGHVENGEDCFDGAEREVLEETHISIGEYEALEQYPIYFEYKTRQQVLKKVHLWVARYLNIEKPVQLSPEHDEFQWLDYEAAKAVVKRQYKEALMAADLVIRTYESL